MEFRKGEKYKYYMKLTGGNRKKKTFIKDCVIVQDCERHVVIDTGKYKESVSKASLLTKEERLVKVV